MKADADYERIKQYQERCEKYASVIGILLSNIKIAIIALEAYDITRMADHLGEQVCIVEKMICWDEKEQGE